MRRAGGTDGGVVPSAFAACRVAAEEGDAAAQFMLSKHYYFGDQVEKDLDRAARWFSAAADQGHQEAQENLGRL